MSVISSRYLVVAIVSIVLCLAAMLVSFEAYFVAKSIQVAPSVVATQRGIGENFNWKIGEVVDVQGNWYAYLGYEFGIATYANLQIAKWQNAWMPLSYGGFMRESWINITLSPYKLYVRGFNENFLNATFFES